MRGDRKRRRWPQLGVAVTVTVVVLRLVYLAVRVHQAEQPWNAGYSRVGAVAGTTFWVRASSATIAIRGVHGQGDGCDYNGPDVSAAGQSRVSAVLPAGAGGGRELCELGGLRGTDFAALLLPSSAPPVTVALSDGSTAAQTASLDLSAVDPGENIRVVFVDRPGVSITTP